MDSPHPFRNLLQVWWLVAAVVVVDHLTKWWALRELDDGRVITIVPTLEFDLTFNRGFSFGTAGRFGPWIGALVVGVCVLLIAAIRRAPRIGQARILALILGGALGNLIDRAFRADDGFLTGEVVDFIDVTWYAVFNVADICVVCGSVLLVVAELHANREPQPEVPG